MERKNNVPKEIMERIKRYPELDEQVNSYLKTLDAEKEKHLSVEAVKALEMHDDVSPLKGIFSASVGEAGQVPAEVTDVLKKYPEFEKSVNSYLEKMYKESEYHLSTDAVEMLLSHADVEPVKLDPVPQELNDVISKYPDVKDELNSYIDDMRKQQELHLSIHALKALKK